MRKKLLISNAEGFTLVELLVVMVIIGLLATLVAPGLFKQFGKSQHKAAIAQIASIEQGLDKFRLDTGRYPTTQEGLASLVTNPGIEKWDGPYIKSSLLVDPWNKPYQYQSPGTHGEFDLFSYGRDGQPGGEGQDKDITSWE
jgi:general secretion pathway protein G